MNFRKLIAAGSVISLLGGPAVAANLTFWHAYAGQKDKEEFISYALKEFAKEYPDIKLDVVAADNSAYKTKLKTAMAAGNPPDVFYTLPGGFLGAFVAGHQVEPLNAPMKKGGWGASFLPSALAQTTINGKIYAAPVDIDSTVFWYDKALFARKGWQVPKTWEELLALAKKIKADGMIPFALGDKDGWPATFWFQYLEMRLKGAGQVNAFVQGKPGASLMPEAVEAFTRIAKLAKAGDFPIGVNGMSDQEANMLFLNGRAAMLLNGTWQIGASADAPVGFKLGSFPFPRVKGGKGDPSDVLAGVAAAFSISSKAQDKDAALKLVRFLTSPTVMKKYVELRKTMVTVKGATTKAAAGPVLYHISHDLLAKAGHLDPFYDTAMAPKAATVYYSVLQGVLDGSLAPTEAAKRLEAALETSSE